jgi:hypothetical protein
MTKMVKQFKAVDKKVFLMEHVEGQAEGLVELLKKVNPNVGIGGIGTQSRSDNGD